MRSRALTDRQQVVLDTIVRLTAARGFPPSLRELGEALGIRSTNGVDDHLVALEKKGWIVRAPRVSRGIRVVPVEESTCRG